MDISSITGGATGTSSIDTSRKSIADNFDTFLSLLTTQLKNQNPLDPMDTNQFTQQLVQFTSVEQQLKTNEYLEALVLATNAEDINKNDANNQAINLIGKTVVSGTSVSELKDGKASWTYTIGSDAPDADVTILDRTGKVVYSETVELKKGQGVFEWDGQDESGLDYDEGLYTIAIDARDANKNPLTVLTQVQGVVQSVNLTGDEPILTIGDSRITLGSILSVAVTNTTDTTDTTDTTNDTDTEDDSTDDVTGDDTTGDDTEDDSSTDNA